MEEPARNVHSASLGTSWLQRYRLHLIVVVTICLIGQVLLICTLARLLKILNRSAPRPANNRSPKRRAHLLVVLGSGGHTAEMMSILNNLGHDYLAARFDRRTWVVSEGDNFSALRARDFELSSPGCAYDVVFVRRARRVHQSLLTAPFTALQCMHDCVKVLRGEHWDLQHHKGDMQWHTPHLIMTNGPGTGVVVVCAGLLLLFFGLIQSEGDEERTILRSVYIESWARVKSLSLSGKILRWCVNRFLVQWPSIAGTSLVDTRSRNEKMPSADSDNTLEDPFASLPRKLEYVGAVIT